MLMKMDCQVSILPLYKFSYLFLLPSSSSSAPSRPCFESTSPKFFASFSASSSLGQTPTQPLASGGP